MNSKAVDLEIYYCEEIPDHLSQHSLAYLLLDFAGKRRFPGEWPEHPVFERTSLGKPYLAGYPQLNFNISHCKEGVACVVGNIPAGIDIERRFSWKEPLAKRICHPEEWHRLQGLEEQERAALLGLIWSRKESYLKCIGTGIRRELRDINVLQESSWLPSSSKLPASSILPGEDGVPGRYLFSGFQTERYTLAVCYCREKGDLPGETNDNMEAAKKSQVFNLSFRKTEFAEV